MENTQKIGLLNKLIILSFLIGYGGAGLIFLTINENEDNAGAFKAMLAIVLLGLGALITTILGLLSAAKGFIQGQHKSQSFLNSPWLALLLNEAATRQNLPQH